MTDLFEEDLKKAREFHGHVCTGIVFGVRMARAGLNYLGIEDPAENKDFIVFVEVDRCLADAVQSVTGCSLGKRRLKWLDYGKMAASFIDMNTGKGVRIAVDAKQNAPEDADPVSYWKKFSDEQMFTMEPITVALKPGDLPGRPTAKTICENCQEKIMDGRDMLKDGKVLCKACANGAYYQKI
ncbi:FmdE family protein [Pelotomaculum terephthalicicum JT]|uniref:FmdE family protein n=1 Tax=Pelotomaculum terephthalicicum TaxID=206393 RepID=UPI001F03940E|nr:FmdE family protein [Pelotomaculum terephthalicicum]MCG9967401.1 FmdE family protein [Pelotomaculum terephthalicicum JT]